MSQELRLYSSAVSDETIKEQVNLLDWAFRSALTGAVKQELNRMRRNGLSGQDLLRALIDVYHEHDLGRAADRSPVPGEDDVPVIVCSEALV